MDLSGPRAPFGEAGTRPLRAGYLPGPPVHGKRSGFHPPGARRRGQARGGAVPRKVQPVCLSADDFVRGLPAPARAAEGSGDHSRMTFHRHPRDPGEGGSSLGKAEAPWEGTAITSFSEGSVRDYESICARLDSRLPPAGVPA
jgi:hypothetical protein